MKLRAVAAFLLFEKKEDERLSNKPTAKKNIKKTIIKDDKIKNKFSQEANLKILLIKLITLLVNV